MSYCHFGKQSHQKQFDQLIVWSEGSFGSRDRFGWAEEDRLSSWFEKKISEMFVCRECFDTSTRDQPMLFFGQNIPSVQTISSSCAWIKTIQSKLSACLLSKPSDELTQTIGPTFFRSTHRITWSVCLADPSVKLNLQSILILITRPVNWPFFLTQTTEAESVDLVNLLGSLLETKHTLNT